MFSLICFVMDGNSYVPVDYGASNNYMEHQVPFLEFPSGVPEFYVYVCWLPSFIHVDYCELLIFVKYCYTNFHNFYL